MDNTKQTITTHEVNGFLYITEIKEGPEEGKIRPVNPPEGFEVLTRHYAKGHSFVVYFR